MKEPSRLSLEWRAVADAFGLDPAADRSVRRPPTLPASLDVFDVVSSTVSSSQSSVSSLDARVTPASCLHCCVFVVSLMFSASYLLLLVCRWPSPREEK